MPTTFGQLAARLRSWRPRFCLRTAFLAMLFVALVIGWARDHVRLRQSQQVEGAIYEIYADRTAFEQRLAGDSDYVDFDDIAINASGVAAFEPTRYESQGIIIKGGGGQYVSRTFGLPADFTAVSPPNLYAPGPVGQNPGANRTEVTFVTAAGGPGLVCGFGLNFVDVDFPDEGPSSITVFDRHGRRLLSHGNFKGPNRTPVFRGIVAVDASGTPLPLIARVRLVNGSGWPGVDILECVALDDFVFGVPQPYPK